MKILRSKTSQNGAEELTFSQGAFLVSHILLPENEGGGADERALWPQMLRVIHEVRPAWIVGENVSGILSMVQPADEVRVARQESLFGASDLYRKEQLFTIEAICRDLECAGYSVQPLVIPACAVGAPHRRDRVWIVAHADGQRDSTPRAGGGTQSQWGDADVQPSQRSEPTERAARLSAFPRTACDSDLDGLQRQILRGGDGEQGRDRPLNAASQLAEALGTRNALNAECLRRNACEYDDELVEGAQQTECGQVEPRRTDCPQDWWRDFPTQSPVRCRDDGLFPTPHDITLSWNKWREETIKAYGNAWVPQVAYEIFRFIDIIENEQATKNYEFHK